MQDDNRERLFGEATAALSELVERASALTALAMDPQRRWPTPEEQTRARALLFEVAALLAENGRVIAGALAMNDEQCLAYLREIASKQRDFVTRVDAFIASLPVEGSDATEN